MLAGVMPLLLFAALACDGSGASSSPKDTASAGKSANDPNVDPRCVRSSCSQDTPYLDKYDCDTFYKIAACIPELEMQLQCYRSHAMCNADQTLIASSISAPCKGLADATIACLNKAGGAGSGP
jgi:hypothetical protein